jgi:phosphoribosylformimino-5-aminoimidazole carboxamide ribotide isomerase
VQVIPVIDLMRGQVVRGVGGRRDEYRPIESRLAADSQPQSVGRALSELGFRTVYVADLDAIVGGTPAWSTYEELIASPLDLWVDAGLSTPEQARDMARFDSRGNSLAGIILGLESIAHPSALAEMCAAVGRQRLMFSLDMKRGVPLTRWPAWRELNPLAIAAIALRGGVRRIIVLDLANVGMGQGVGTERLCRELRCLEPSLEIIAGGGIRGPKDLSSLQAAGCDAALVASALHDGRLSPAECARPTAGNLP